jgi:hypothetical protein
MMVQSIDAWIVSQETLIRRDQTLIPVVRERQFLADSLSRYMTQLGLQRRHKVKSLQEILSADHADGKAD